MPEKTILKKAKEKNSGKMSGKPNEAEVPIVQNGAPVLRELAQTVPVADITSPKIKKIISDMKAALAGQDDGVAIAAPQIGEPLRIFVVSGAVLSAADEKYTGGDIVFINPEITKLSREKHDVEEGCLSVRWLYGKVKRSQKATIRGYDESGKRVLRGASGLLAQVFQHETDHLDGILFIDKARDVKDMPPENENSTTVRHGYAKN
jgi:peptide deformylase